MTQSQPFTGSLLRVNWSLIPPEHLSTLTGLWTLSSVRCKTLAHSPVSPPTPPARLTKQWIWLLSNSRTFPTTQTTSRSLTRDHRTFPRQPEAAPTGATWLVMWRVVWIRGWWQLRPRHQLHWSSSTSRGIYQEFGCSRYSITEARMTHWFTGNLDSITA